MRANSINKKNISLICIALCLIFSGGYIFQQNYRVGKIYDEAGPYDYIPAEESKTILEMDSGMPIDSITAVVPVFSRGIALLRFWEEIRTSAQLPDIDRVILSFTENGECAIWHRATRKEQKRLVKLLPRLVSNNYPPVNETEGEITVNHYALHDGQFLHTLSAPGVIAFSFEPSLFKEAQQTIDILNRRERFVKAYRSLDPKAPARLLQQISDRSRRSSGRWEGKSIYSRTTGPDTIPTLPTDSLP